MSIDHDQIFKTLIETFLQEFLLLFFPKVAAEIDFSSVEFLKNEQFTDVPRGKRRQLDLVVKVRLTSGESRFLLIHFEFESERPDEHFAARMYAYHCQLFLRHRIVAIPIVVFSDDTLWRVPVSNRFELGLAGITSVIFEYQMVKLKAIDYRSFLDSANPLAYALMAKMNYNRSERVRLKADFLRLIMGAKIDPARESLLLEFVETYIPLATQEQAEFSDLVRSDEAYQGIRKMITVYEQQGIEKGIAQGIEQGIQQGIERGIERGIEKGIAEASASLRRTLCQALEKKFGPVSQSLKQKINAIESIEQLQVLFLKVFDIERAEDLLQ